MQNNLVYFSPNVPEDREIKSAIDSTEGETLTKHITPTKPTQHPNTTQQKNKGKPNQNKNKPTTQKPQTTNKKQPINQNPQTTTTQHQHQQSNLKNTQPTSHQKHTHITNPTGDTNITDL